MSSTHLSLNYHVIFATKHRERWFTEAFQLELHAYLGGTLNNLACQSLCVGGVEDHVHLLFTIPATLNLSDVIRELKKHSSLWIKEKLSRTAFAWQTGYGAFTVSAPALPDVKEYIHNQKAHHQTTSFQDEYVNFLKRSGVEYDAKYLW